MRIKLIGDAWDLKNADRTLMEKFKPQSTSDVAAMRLTGETFDYRRILRNFKLLCWRSFAEQVKLINSIKVYCMYYL